MIPQGIFLVVGKAAMLGTRSAHQVWDEDGASASIKGVAFSFKELSFSAIL